MFTISYSQISTFKDCKKKWYFDAVLKLPRIGSASTDRGSILHEVCERYLTADAQGRVPDTEERHNPEHPLHDQEPGKAVELYPEGWYKVRDRKGKVTGEIPPVDQAMIKSLIAMAQEHGILVRKPGGVVERKIERKMTPLINFVGFIDYDVPVGVEDHKTSKSTRYLLSKKKLATDLQINLYTACWVMDRQERGLKIPNEVLVAHNQFVFDKDKPQVRRIEVLIKPEDAMNVWTQTIEVGRQMLRAAGTKDYKDFDDPPAGTCNKYGGCPRLSICARGESIEAHKTRLSRPAQSAISFAPSSTPLPSTTKPMGIRDKMRSASTSSAPTTNAAAPVAAPQLNSPPIEQPAAPSAEPSMDPKPAGAPWAKPDCSVCSDTTRPGFNGNGNICRSCASWCKKERGYDPKDHYEVGVDGNEVWWEPKNDDGKGGGSGGSLPLTAAPVAKVQEATPEPEPAPEPQPEPAAPVAATEPEPEPQPEPEPKTTETEVVVKSEKKVAPRKRASTKKNIDGGIHLHIHLETVEQAMELIEIIRAL